MCGIAGILRVHPPGTTAPPPHEAIPEAWLDILDESIKHRGPDGQGRFRDRAVRTDGTVVDVALVHRRMAIIDLMDGAQPMVSSKGRNEHEKLVAIVFNGCIYNHRKLRTALEAAGHRFETDHSDTEVLVHGWRDRQHRILSEAVGMLAAAIWDHHAASLVLGRDYSGEKPLYWSRLDPETIAFASTCAGLLRLRATLGKAVSCSRQILTNWVRMGFHHQPPGSLYAVEPRSWISFGAVEESGPIHAEPDWPDEPTPGRARFTDELLRRAVATRLESDVPLGCFLSGGVDSSLIAAYASKITPDLQTFTVRMPDARYDESPFAEAVSRHLRTRHTTLDCSPRPAEDLPRLIRQLGLPFGDSSLLPTYWVSQSAGRHVRVALAGDGGDEFFLGYERHVTAGALTWGSLLLRLVPSGFLRSADPKSSRAKVRKALSAAKRNDFYELLALYQHEDLHNVLPSSDSAEVSTQRLWVSRWNHGRTALSHIDQTDYLPNDLLRKTDTASMSVPIEVRSPMLDHTVIAWTWALGPRRLMPFHRRKGLLRQVARKYLPAEIVDRPKQGFAIPIGDWFRNDYGGMKQLLLDHLNSTDPWPGIGVDLNRPFVRQMLDEHMGTGPSGRIVRDHSQRLYMLLVLSIWAKWMASL